MLTREHFFCCAVVVAGLAVSAAAPVAAAPITPEVVSPPRTCTLGNETIQAGPDGEGGTTGPFPVQEPCPATIGDTSTGLTGQCLKWEYRWTCNDCDGGPNPDFVSFDSDLTILAAEGGVGGFKVSNFGIDNTDHPNPAIKAGGERFLTFPTGGVSPFVAKFWTRPGVTVGTLTAGIETSSDDTPIITTCQLAGAGDPISNPALAQTSQVTDQAGPCSIRRTIDAQGCTTDIQILNDSCSASVANAVLEIDNVSSKAIGCNTRVTAQGSPTRYCYPMPTGAMKCVILP